MIWKEILRKLQNDIPVCLLLVIESKGSSPGRKGFKMLVAADGSLSGSIGGGLMEYQLVEEARNLLRTNSQKCFTKRKVHRKSSPHSSGMICSGEQIVAFIPIRTTEAQIIKKIANSPDSNHQQKINISPKGIKLLPLSGPGQLECHFFDEQNWQYEELPAHQAEAYIIGAGHVGQATARLLHFLHYRVFLLDNRRDLLNKLRGQIPATLLQVKYEQITKHIPEKAHLSVVLMTTRYDEDLLVLRQLLPHPYRYLGMMGSRAKVKQIFNQLTAEGIKPEWLQRVQAPIGLLPHCKTPEEIALSVAAALVAQARAD